MTMELELLDDAPTTWTGPHVGRRLTEGMRTLAELPMSSVRGYAAWPAYSYEWDDLLAQQAQGELERTQALQNRIRLLPSSREVQRMEQAIIWPAQFLARLTPILVAVNAVALAHAFDRDFGLGRGQARRLCRHLARAARTGLRHHRARPAQLPRACVLRGERDESKIERAVHCHHGHVHGRAINPQRPSRSR